MDDGAPYISRGALAGRRVLELGVYIAGPLAGRMLCQLGAEVVKVESSRGDPARTESSHANFVAHNAGKKSVVVDLRSDEGREVFDQLVRVSDVVLTNLAPDALAHLGLTYERCANANDRIVVCKIRGYGPGPRHDEVATNPLVEASSGVMYRNRVDGRPVRQGLSYYDMAASAYAVVGILAALMSPPDDKRARDIEVGLYESGLYMAAGSLVGEQYKAGQGQAPDDPTTFARPGYGSYRTADDRWIYLLMLTDAQWRHFCEIMQIPDGNDPSLATVPQRSKRGEYVESVVRAAVGSITYDELSARLTHAGFGHTEVRPAATVLDNEQARQPGKLVDSEFDGRQFRLPVLPIVGGVVRTPIRDDPPELGQHTVEMLRAAGYAEERASDLARRGVVSVNGSVPKTAGATAR